MNIRRIFIIVTAVMLTSAVFADSSSVTSKKYVDDFMTGYQNKIPGSGTNKLMIYDSNESDGINQKAIVSSLGEDTSATDVPNVGAVKAGMDGKQDTINGTAGYVMTGMGTNRPGEIGERAIYGTAVYSNSLVTAETVNTGVTNAVNSSLIRVDENGNPSDNGTLWEINTGLYALGVLPAGYTQLEWIKSNGAQYIDTQITQSTRAVIDVEASAISGDTIKFIMAPYDATSYKNGFGVYIRSIAAFTDLNATVRNVWDITYNSSSLTLTLDGTTRTSQTYYIANDARIALLGSTSSSRRLTAKLYSVKIYNKDSLVFDGVPASKVENSVTLVGLYDMVSKRFFTSATSTGLVAGPPI